MNDSGRGEFWAFMAGLLAGGVAALLYAPAKGEDTRRKIRETAEDAYHKGEEYYEKGITEAENIYRDGKVKAEKIYEDGKHKVEEVVEAVQGKKSHKADPATAKAEK